MTGDRGFRSREPVRAGETEAEAFHGESGVYQQIVPIRDVGGDCR